MQPLPPPTPFESNMLTAYQMLSQVRMRNSMLNTPVGSCLDKCVDLSDLLKNARSKKETMIRLKEDENEKKCLEFCAMKWDELNRGMVQLLTRREVASVQREVFNEIKKSTEAQLALSEGE